MRLRLPDGFCIAPHHHAQPEIVTVISGTFRLGMGEEADPEATTVLEPGSFFAYPPGMHNYAYAEGESVNSTGLWAITYVSKADVPGTERVAWECSGMLPKGCGVLRHEARVARAVLAQRRSNTPRRRIGSGEQPIRAGSLGLRPADTVPIGPSVRWCWPTRTLSAAVAFVDALQPPVGRAAMNMSASACHPTRCLQPTKPNPIGIGPHLEAQIQDPRKSSACQ